MPQSQSQRSQRSSLQRRNSEQSSSQARCTQGRRSSPSTNASAMGAGMRNKQSGGTSNNSKLIPDDLFIELAKDIDTILSTPIYDPFTGRSPEKQKKKSPSPNRSTLTSLRSSSARSTGTSSNSRALSSSACFTGMSSSSRSLSSSARFTGMSSVTALDIGADLMTSFSIDRFGSPSGPSPSTLTKEELVAQWSKNSVAAPTDATSYLKVLSLFQTQSVDRTEPSLHAGPPSLPDPMRESLKVEPVPSNAVSELLSVPIGSVSEDFTGEPEADINDAASGDVDDSPSSMVDRAPAPTESVTDVGTGDHSMEAKDTASGCTGRARKVANPKRFTPPPSSRRALEEVEEGDSFSPSEARCVEEAADRLREHLIERFGSARKAFIALRKAGEDHSKPGLRCGEMITTKELKLAMRKLGVHCAQVSGYGNINKIIRYLDDSGDGSLTFEELMDVQPDLSSSEEEEEEDESQLTWQQKRAIADQQKLEASRKQPRWNPDAWKKPWLRKKIKSTNIVGRDMILSSDKGQKAGLAEGDLPIWQRYEKTRMEKAAALAEEQRRRRQEELELCTFQPTCFTQRVISEKEIDHNAADLSQSRPNATKGEERLASDHLQHYGLQYSFQPKVLDRSTKIYQYMRRDVNESLADRLSRATTRQRRSAKGPTTSEEFSFAPNLRAGFHKRPQNSSITSRILQNRARAGNKNVIKYSTKLDWLFHSVKANDEGALASCRLREDDDVFVGGFSGKSSPRSVGSDTTRSPRFNDDDELTLTSAVTSPRSETPPPRPMRPRGRKS